MTNGCSPVAVGAFACKYADAVLEKHRCFSWADATDDLDAKDAKVEISRGAAAEPASRGAISQLQEYVQDAKRFPVPSNCPVLQWDYDTRMCSTSLEFRATVAFLLDGVPHHSAGIWKPSKKLAQRDAAERALALYVDLWGDLAAATGREGALGPGHGDVEALRSFCRRLAVHHPAPPPEFDHRWDGEGRCHSLVQVELLGVSHTFSGQPRDSPEEADADVARRVLWYLQCPGLEDAFEPDWDFARAVAQEIPEPATTRWAKDNRDDETEVQIAEQVAERKTTVMRVQNRLQQLFAKQIETGSTVWHWSYMRDKRDKQWPPRYRAVVRVPLVSQSFSSDWIRGQKEAQIDACEKLLEFLEAQFPK